ncbi:hypothetical protein KBC04_01235 [Candidatus Babeliales bacterium]|nr:hypothetical protein [Candidatus Babeliales bacterium]MBP9843650.1 hypothetical protein [Candidatus Babeliales bacterium]
MKKLILLLCILNLLSSSLYCAAQEDAQYKPSIQRIRSNSSISTISSLSSDSLTDRVNSLREETQIEHSPMPLQRVEPMQREVLVQTQYEPRKYQGKMCLEAASDYAKDCDHGYLQLSQCKRPRARQNIDPAARKNQAECTGYMACCCFYLLPYSIVCILP